jgi:hypothetical protein
MIVFAFLPGGLTWTTQAQSGGRPILVVYNASAPNPFGRYLGEILRAEGLNSFDMSSLGSVNATQLALYRVVVLAQTPLNAAQATLFTNYVNGGGHLVAMRPDAQIKGLFGLATASGTQSNGYLKMPGSGPSQGLNTSTLQIHGDTDKYTVTAGTETIAQLYSNATTATAFPAVVRNTDGHGVAFLYDLARNVVYTRQGNPANADVNVDGDDVFRTIDLFQTLGGGSPWVNLDKVPIPQADMQQRLFARLIRDAINIGYPMPQLWYFPGVAKTMLIPTADAHANPAAWFQTLVDVLNNHNADITFYLSIGELSTDNMALWRSQGHEFGIHPYVFYDDPSYDPYDIHNLAEGYDVYDTWFAATFGIAPSRTVRNHQVAWQGWTTAAEIAIAHGMAMDTNFYAWGGWLQKADSSWAHGYVNGSGQPMKFMKADGAILPYFQQVTTLIDEQLVHDAGMGTTFEDLDTAGATTVSQQVIDASLAGNYAAVMTQFHVDYVNATQGWVNNTLAYANSNNIPIWNADDWLTFTETRYNASFTNLNWNNSTRTLSFDLSAPSQSDPRMTLSIMLPLSYDGAGLESVTGATSTFTFQSVYGSYVAFITVQAGNRHIVVDYEDPPVSAPNSAPTTNWYRTPAVKLRWNQVSWADSYQIQVALSPTFTAPLVMDSIVPASTLSTTVNVLQEGTFHWRVRARNSQSIGGAWSATQSFTVDLP